MIQFQLEQIGEARDELRDSLQEGIDADTIEPYLGDHRHEVLGEITLQWRDEQLILDVGEFETEVRARVDEEGAVKYLTFEPPLAGFPVEFEEGESGEPILVLGVGVVEYTFEKVE